MDALLEGIDVDFVIRIPYNPNQKIKLKNSVIYNEHEYLMKKKEKIKNYDVENNIDRGIIMNKDLNIDSGKFYF